MDAPLVRVDRDGDVAVLTLADPAHRNALSLEMTRAIAAAVDSVGDAGAIVLAAEPPVFCAGGSLDDLLAPRAPLEEMYAGFLALAAAPVPTVAAVGGACVGAGVNLPLACDVIVASPSARFDPRFLDIGIHPGGGHLWRLSERVGRQAAAALVLCGAVLDGEAAAAKGLAWSCVPEESLVETAVGLARRAAGRPRAVVARTKASLDASVRGGLEAATAVELEAQRWSMTTPEFAERVAAAAARLDRDR